MKKIIALLISLSLLLSVLVGCQSEPESEPEPTTTYPTSTQNLIWGFRDRVLEGYQYTIAPNLSRAIKVANDLEDVLICVYFNAEVAEEYIEEWGTETYPVYLRDELECFGQKSDRYSAAALTLEQIKALEKYDPDGDGYGIVMRLYLPPRPNGYPNGISNDLAVALEYLQQESYLINKFSGNGEFVSAQGVEMTKEEIISKISSGSISAVCLADSIYIPGYPTCYVTEVQDGELTNQTEVG